MTPLSVWLSGTDSRLKWLDKALEARFLSLAQAFPGRQIDLYQESQDHGRALALVGSPSHPPANYVVDYATGTATIVGEAYPALAEAAFGEVSAITYTARYPESVRALLIVDVGPEIEARGRENIQSFISGIDELDSFEAFVERAYRFNPRRSLANLRQRLSHNLKQLPNGKWTWKFDQKRLGAGARSGIGPEGLWEDVRKIRCPTLIIRGGESDILAPEAAERLRAAIPNSRVTVVPGAGHSVMGDNPAGFATAVQEFLRTIG